MKKRQYPLFPQFVETRHGHFMVPPNDAFIGKSLKTYGEYCEGEAALFNLIVPREATVIEIGANIGALTVPLSRSVGPHGMVYAIEPQLPIFNLLCGNLALNGITNVRPMHCAMGQTHGSVNIPLYDIRDDRNFGGVGLSDNEETQTTVPMLTVDKLGLEQCHMLKIDVEGHEIQVLQGALQTIAKHRPILFVENDRQEKSVELIRLIQSMDYDLWWYPVPLFQTTNYNQYPDDIFGDVAARNMLAYPKESKVILSDFRPITNPSDWW